jgi:hypothetical protein
VSGLNTNSEIVELNYPGSWIRFLKIFLPDPTGELTQELFSQTVKKIANYAQI